MRLRALPYQELWLYVDLAAERSLAAEKAGRKIVVEIKVFGTSSPVAELERAIRLDSDVIEWYKQQGRGWQTQMNTLLRAYMEECEAQASSSR